jgi:hypothetical protein
LYVLHIRQSSRVLCVIYFITINHKQYFHQLFFLQLYADGRTAGIRANETCNATQLTRMVADYYWMSCCPHHGLCTTSIRYYLLKYIGCKLCVFRCAMQP